MINETANSWSAGRYVNLEPRVDLVEQEPYRQVDYEAQLAASFVSDNSRIAITELPVLLKEGVKFDHLKDSNVNLENYDDKGYLYESEPAEFENLRNYFKSFVTERTDLIKSYIEYKSYDELIDSPEQLAAAIQLMLEEKMKYDYRLAHSSDSYDRSLANEFDEKSSTELLETGQGICRHYTKVFKSVYEAFKENQSGLNHTSVLPLNVGKDHVSPMLVMSDGEDLIVGNFDPTWFSIEEQAASFSDVRAVAGLNMIVESGILQEAGIDIPVSEFLSVVQDAERRQVEVMQKVFEGNMDAFEDNPFLKPYDLGADEFLDLHIDTVKAASQLESQLQGGDDSGDIASSFNEMVFERFEHNIEEALNEVYQYSFWLNLHNIVDISVKGIQEGVVSRFPDFYDRYSANSGNIPDLDSAASELKRWINSNYGERSGFKRGLDYVREYRPYHTKFLQWYEETIQPSETSTTNPA